MQLSTQRSEEIIQNVKFKERDVDLWMHRNELPTDIKEIMSNITHILKEKKDVDVEKLLPHLPLELRKGIKNYLCKPLLRKVSLFLLTSFVSFNIYIYIYMYVCMYVCLVKLVCKKKIR